MSRTWYHIISCWNVSYYIISYPILACQIISYPMILHPILSYLILSYHILSYHIKSYQININKMEWNKILWNHIILYYIKWKTDKSNYFNKIKSTKLNEGARGRRWTKSIRDSIKLLEERERICWHWAELDKARQHHTTPR